MNWNEFRKAHKGLSKTEMSDLWKKYKAGEYEYEEPLTESLDPNHGHDLDHIEEVEQEIKREEKEQKFLNRLNNKQQRSQAVRSITHYS